MAMHQRQGWTMSIPFFHGPCSPGAFRRGRPGFFESNFDGNVEEFAETVWYCSIEEVDVGVLLGCEVFMLGKKKTTIPQMATSHGQLP